MKIIAIIQARMTSTRLPGKVLKEVLDKPILEFQIERLKRSKLLSDIVIATTTNSTDDPIVELCESLSLNYYRGSEHDVLSRYYEAAVKYDADTIVRITSDCPLIDPNVVDLVIQTYLDRYPELQYVSNVLERSYPRGLDTEVFAFAALKQAFELASNVSDREHVTPYIINNTPPHGKGNVRYHEDQSLHRWTVDTPEDLELITRIIESLYPNNPQFRLEDVLALLQDFPSWIEINSHIRQKEA